MQRWRWFVLEIVVLGVAVAALALAEHFGIEWMRVAALIVGIGGTGALVMAAKQRRQGQTRSAEPDSVEAVQDTSARAGAYLDALVLTAVAIVVVSLWPTLPPVVVLVALLALFGLVYWLRRAFSSRG